MSTQRDKLVKS